MKKIISELAILGVSTFMIGNYDTPEIIEKQHETTKTEKVVEETVERSEEPLVVYLEPEKEIKYKIKTVYVPVIVNATEEVCEVIEHKHIWEPVYITKSVAIDSIYVEHYTCRACKEDVSHLMDPLWQFQEHAQAEKQLGMKNAGKYSVWGEWVPIYEDQEVLDHYICSCGEECTIEDYEDEKEE